MSDDDTTDDQTGDGDTTDDTGADGAPETFPREYVEQLRRENAQHRTRAQRADEATARLLDASIASATAGILADADDLRAHVPADALVDDDGWPDPERIAEAARALVQRKPHLGDGRPRGDIDQGTRDTDGDGVSLAGMMRRLAG